MIAKTIAHNKFLVKLKQYANIVDEYLIKDEFNRFKQGVSNAKRKLKRKNLKEYSNSPVGFNNKRRSTLGRSPGIENIFLRPIVESPVAAMIKGQNKQLMDREYVRNFGVRPELPKKEQRSDENFLTEDYSPSGTATPVMQSLKMLQKKTKLCGEVDLERNSLLASRRSQMQEEHPSMKLGIEEMRKSLPDLASHKKDHLGSLAEEPVNFDMTFN